MPYLHCPSCRLATFSAARYSHRDECPRCGTPLKPEPRRLFDSSDRPSSEHPVVKLIRADVVRSSPRHPHVG
jgi:hypothetical protein